MPIANHDESKTAALFANSGVGVRADIGGRGAVAKVPLNNDLSSHLGEIHGVVLAAQRYPTNLVPSTPSNLLLPPSSSRTCQLFGAVKMCRCKKTGDVPKGVASTRVRPLTRKVTVTLPRTPSTHRTRSGGNNTEYEVITGRSRTPRSLQTEVELTCLVHGTGAAGHASIYKKTPS